MQLPNWLKFLAPKPPELSKRAQRRLRHTSVIHDGPMKGRDGRVRHVRWLWFDIGRFLDRSKYNVDGTRK